jgi:dihydroorotate dehydrogenase (NAD+) catalytic subunit
MDAVAPQVTPVAHTGRELDPPVLNASGAVDPFAVDPDWRFEPHLLAQLGAFVTKTTTENAAPGNPKPWVEVMPGDAASLVNAVGLANPGISATLVATQTLHEQLGIPILLSLAGSPGSCTRMVQQAEACAWIWGYELNLSCPNTSGGLVATDPVASAATVAAVRAATARPVIAKLSPAASIARVGVAVCDAGADFVAAVNTIPILAVGTDGAPLLGSRRGGMSGRALHHIALGAVADLADHVDVPIIGIGGVDSVEAARRMCDAGASLVGVGTAAVLDPSVFTRIIAGFPARGIAPTRCR